MEQISEKGKKAVAGVIIALATLIAFSFTSYFVSEKEKENIEQTKRHYADFLENIKKENYAKAYQQIKKFDYDFSCNYKNFKKLKEEVLNAVVKTVPDSDYQKNLELYKQLSALDLDNALYKKKLRQYEKAKHNASCQIQIMTFNVLSNGINSVCCKGTIKNVSNKSLAFVKVIATWYDANGREITTRSALVNVSSLKSGQTSSFEVETVDASLVYCIPKIESASIRFAYALSDKKINSYCLF